jgi:hypothetical protein
MKKLLQRAKMGPPPRRIGIVIVATNAYFVLGVRFIKKFVQFYTGSDEITFYFFSDEDPTPYVQESIQVKYIEDHHDSWLDGANSKFKNILKLEGDDVDYIYFFDADTSINREFDADWMIGDLVGGEHFGNRHWMKVKKDYDRNPRSKAYVPEDTKLPEMYYYGAFFGGRKEETINLCKTLREWQLENKKIGHEPRWNDESYLNAYLHYNPPTYVVRTEKFPFLVSAKSGIEETRNPQTSVEDLKAALRNHRDDIIDIVNGKLIVAEKVKP